MICQPCAAAADEDPGGHPAEVCDDHGKTPEGCTCQHGAERPHGPQEGP